jgi:vacuolar-type H+-ATPase subunit I/STV1
MLEIHHHDEPEEKRYTLNNDVQAFASILDYLNQSAIWAFNAWGASDALVDRTSHASLIKRLEELSAMADTINDEAKALSKELRAELRPLMKQVKTASEMVEAMKPVAQIPQKVKKTVKAKSETVK